MAYYWMGKSYQGLKDYAKSVICFKKMLQLAWLLEGQLGCSYEMLAYDGLALQNFYLGDQSKSKYYDDRAMRGKSEAAFSIQRQMSNRGLLRESGWVPDHRRQDIGLSLRTLLSVDYLGKQPETQ